jgi:hypothetical protein
MTPSAWVHSAASGLGIGTLPEALMHPLNRALPAPAGDPRYRDATLVADGVPLELSFSETAPAALRLDFEPLAAASSVRERRAWTVRTYARLVASMGAPSDDEAADAASDGDDDRFGAYLGAMVSSAGIEAANLYLPCHAAAGATAVDRIARDVMRAVPALAPRFRRWSTGTPQRRRVYLVATTDLPLRAVADALAAVGLAGRAAELWWMLSAMTGSAPFLPAERAVISVADRGDSCELKIELLARGWPSPGALVDAAMRLLQQRPESVASFHRWRRAISAVCEVQPSDVTAVGLRIFGTEPVQLGVYVAPLRTHDAR